MNKNGLKTAFRNTVGHMPKGVRLKMTKEKVRAISAHIMTDEEARRCETDPEYRAAAVKQRMEQFPKQANKVNSRIETALSYPHFAGLSDAERQTIAEDMRFCWFGYGFGIDEYVFYDFSGINHDPETRRQFVSEAERLSFRFCANDFTKSVYADKASAYELLKPYYKRELVSIRGEKDRERYLSFVKGKTRFVQKALSSSRGQGVQLVDLSAVPGGSEAYFTTLVQNGPVLLEEEIIQSPVIRRFNPDSVNTVRLSTFYTRDGVIAPFSVFRIGRKGSFIDNCATGGVCATVDTKTGEIISECGDEHGNRFPAHPDSGQAVKGFRFPEWDKAVALCKEAALKTPDLKYLSWDLAYSENHGWVVVEVNTSGQLLVQGGSLRGIRQEFKQILDRMDLQIPFTIRG